MVDVWSCRSTCAFRCYPDHWIPGDKSSNGEPCEIITDGVKPLNPRVERGLLRNINMNEKSFFKVIKKYLPSLGNKKEALC